MGQFPSQAGKFMLSPELLYYLNHVTTCCQKAYGSGWGSLSHEPQNSGHTSSCDMQTPCQGHFPPWLSSWHLKRGKSPRVGQLAPKDLWSQASVELHHQLAPLGSLIQVVRSVKLSLRKCSRHGDLSYLRTLQLPPPSLLLSSQTLIFWKFPTVFRDEC